MYCKSNTESSKITRDLDWNELAFMSTFTIILPGTKLWLSSQGFPGLSLSFQIMSSTFSFSVSMSLKKTTFCTTYLRTSWSALCSWKGNILPLASFTSCKSNQIKVWSPQFHPCVILLHFLWADPPCFCSLHIFFLPILCHSSFI